MPFNAVNIGTNTGASGATLAITVPAAGVPAGSLIVVAVTEKSTSGTSGTLADTATNTWNTSQGVNLAATAADGRGTVFFAFNSKALVSGNTITYTRNLSAASCAMSACYFTGIAMNANPEDTAARASATGTTGTITVTSGTPANAGDLFVGVLLDSGTSTAGGSATFTQAGGWTTNPAEATTGGSGGSRVDAGWKLGSGTSTQTYNPTLSSTAQQWGLLVTAFRVVPDVVRIVSDLPNQWRSDYYYPHYWDRFVSNSPSYVQPQTMNRPPIRGLPEQPPILLQTWVSVTPFWLIKPFLQSDWPLTPGRYWDLFFSQGPKPVPVTPIYPYRNYDFPNPTNFIARYWDLFWSQQPYEVQVKPFEQVFNQFDWPNPRAPVYWDLFWVQGPKPVQVTPTYPYRNYDWPNPTPPYRLDQFWSEQPYEVQVTDIYPSRNFDWPNPIPVIWYQSWIQGPIPPAVVVVQNPFNQLDWPVPQRIVWYNTWTQSPYEVPVQPFEQVFNQFDWPNPPPVYWYRDWSQSGLIEEEPFPPFRQQDWPLPILRPYWDIFGFTRAQLETPNRQQDWPVPPRILWDQFWSQSPAQVPVTPIYPFRNYDWPNPTQPNRIDQFWAINTSELPPSAIFPIVFGQSDWPLPRPVAWYQDYNQNIILLFPPPVVVVTDLHFKPFMVSMGRMGNLGGLS